MILSYPIYRPMEVERFETPYLSSNSYLIEENGHGIIIDPCEMISVKNRIEDKKLIIDHVILTHEHVDHITGVEWVQNTFGPIVLCSKICGDNLRDARKNSSYYFELFKALMVHLKQKQNIVVKPFTCHADLTFENEMNMEWQGHKFYLRSTPGHADGSICILIDQEVLFTGDTLMADEKTVTSFIGGSMEKMMNITVPWFRSLDRSITVFPGHFDSFVLGERLDWNVF